MDKPKQLKAFPPAYAVLADQIMRTLLREYHLHLLCMVSVAESIPDRQHYTTPADVLGLAIESFSKQLHQRAKNKRKAKFAVAELLRELGFNDGEERADV